MVAPSDVVLTAVVREALAGAVRDTLGLVFPPSRAGALDRGIVAVCARLGEGDAVGLLHRVTRGAPEALDALAEELTVGETYLFRDDGHFAFVRDVAIPEALARGSVVRLWSAGCATGEEAWSLAIVAHEALGDLGARRVEVIGTDLNPRFIERARRGRYGRWSFRGVDPARRERWFRPDGDGWSVAPALRHSVRFAPLNLLDTSSEAWPRGVDVVFCRNVAIYFDLETVGRVAAAIARSLVEGAWLVPGPSDPLLPTGLGLAATVRGALVYRRTTVNPPPPAPPSAVVAVPAPSRAPATPSAPRHVPAPAPVRAGPSDAVTVARALADEGDLAGATRLLNTAVVLDGLDPALYLLRSSVRQAAGDDRGAAADADRAVFLDRSLAFAHVLSAAAHSRLGDSTVARRALRNARALLRSGGDGPVPHSEGQTREGLAALCDRLGRSLDEASRSRRRDG